MLPTLSSLHQGRFDLTGLTTARPHGAQHVASANQGGQAKRFPDYPSTRMADFGGAAESSLKLALLHAADPGAQAARCFIEARYLDIFGSHAPVRYANLLVLRDKDGKTAAALGIRRASKESLFLEQYLDVTVEQAVAATSGPATGRDSIVELGAFAAVSSRAATYLVCAMAAYMQHQGFSHALVTSTGRLRRLFALFDFDLRILGDASKDALPDRGESWGLYYDDAPRVLAGSVQHCFEAVLRERNRQVIRSRRDIIDALILQARTLPSC